MMRVRDQKSSIQRAPSHQGNPLPTPIARSLLWVCRRSHEHGPHVFSGQVPAVFGHAGQVTPVLGGLQASHPL